MTYTDYYPSGLPYTACGAPHPSGEPYRRCSRVYGHPGRQPEFHINDLGNEWRSPVCSTLGCPDPATATVLVGAARLPKCFTHEREYADRYGSGEIHPISGKASRWNLDSDRSSALPTRQLE